MYDISELSLVPSISYTRNDLTYSSPIFFGFFCSWPARPRVNPIGRIYVLSILSIHNLFDILTTIRSLINSCSSHDTSHAVHTPTITTVHIALQWRKETFSVHTESYISFTSDDLLTSFFLFLKATQGFKVFSSTFKHKKNH